MDRMRRALPLAVTVLALGAVTGCGGGSGGGTITLEGAAPASPSAPSVPSTPRSPRAPQAFQVPGRVPQSADGRPADAVSTRVIKKWLSALSASNIPRAGRFFALGAKVQNGTPVLVLRTPAARRLFNSQFFSCGAKATKLQAAKDGFTIVDFVLTERPGGACGGAVGATARGAIKVTDGHIAEWYRLDDPGAPKGGGVATPPPTTPDPALPGTQIT